MTFPRGPRQRGFHPTPLLILEGIPMSPYLFSADFGVTDIGRKARATTTVAEATVLSISDLFAEYAAASKARRAEIRLAAGPGLLAEFDGFNYPAAA